MTAKEKAIEIHNLFKKQIEFNCQRSTVNGVVKQCAIIHVKGIIEELEKLKYKLPCNALERRIYYTEVLNELNQM